MHCIAAIFAAIVVGTWNGNWFPSGRAEHRAHPDVEAATTAAAARMLAHGLDAVDPGRTNDVVLCLNEIRINAASNLVAQIAALGRTNLVVASVSAYRRRDRFDQQQDVVATTLPIVAAGWEKFKPCGKETPPRGYAYASLVFAPASTGTVYATHLKSNYGAGKDKQAQSLNRAKRTHAIEQILAQAEQLGAACPVVVAGDMNADRWQQEFRNEKLFTLLDGAGFLDVLALLPPDQRGTHPSKKWGDSALDYVFARGLAAAALPSIVPNEELSDHNALFTVLVVK